ncbi:MAG TPA: hypothetical protein D7I06_07280, partial [Candidatus Poseidoniales archaeon]
MTDQKDGKQSKNQHPYGPTLAYLDSQISGAGIEYFDKLFQIVGICAEEANGIQHASIYAKVDKSTGETVRGNTTSAFVKKISEVTGRTGEKRISAELHTLTRLGIFIQVTVQDGPATEKRLIVPKWTKDWYQNRREGKYSEDGDQSLYRKCIRSLWFFGQDWEFFYTLKHILDVIDSSKWSSDE